MFKYIILRSVGCVVIELLEGKPPYHFLDPMPAMFRIVQDDCPPIPEGASPIVKDFLYHCFQKDCNLRISARKLLKHPWMISARKQLTHGKTGNVGGRENNTDGAKRPLSNYNYDEAVLKVQEWNEALNCKWVFPYLRRIYYMMAAPSRPSRHLGRSRNATTEHLNSPIPSPVDLAITSLLQPSTSTGSQLSTSALSGLKNGSAPNVKASINLLEKIREPLAFVLQPPEEQTDNWDDDFEEGISFTKLQGQLI
jgi:serine/threonine protein kinase